MVETCSQANDAMVLNTWWGKNLATNSVIFDTNVMKPLLPHFVWFLEYTFSSWERNIYFMINKAGCQPVTGCTSQPNHHSIGNIHSRGGLLFSWFFSNIHICITLFLRLLEACHLLSIDQVPKNPLHGLKFLSREDCFRVLRNRSDMNIRVSIHDLE